MFQKICNYLSILSTVLVLGILGGGFFTFKYVTSEKFQQKLLDKVLDNNLPSMTGPSLPTTKLPKF